MVDRGSVELVRSLRTVRATRSGLGLAEGWFKGRGGLGEGRRVLSVGKALRWIRRQKRLMGTLGGLQPASKEGGARCDIPIVMVCSA